MESVKDRLAGAVTWPPSGCGHKGARPGPVSGVNHVRVPKTAWWGDFVDTTNLGGPSHCCLQQPFYRPPHDAQEQSRDRGVWDPAARLLPMSLSHPPAQPQLKTRTTSTKMLSRSRLTSGIHRAQLTWTHLVPLRVGFIAPPFLGHSKHFG